MWKVADSGQVAKWRSWSPQWTLQTTVCCLGSWILTKMRRILMRKTMIIILFNVVDTDRKSDRQEEQSIDYTWYDQVYLKESRSNM